MIQTRFLVNQLSGKSIISKVMIPVSIDVASEFFRESGDLPISKFPATNELATIVGTSLGYDHVENAKLSLQTLKSRKLKKR